MHFCISRLLVHVIAEIWVLSCVWWWELVLAVSEWNCQKSYGDFTFFFIYFYI